MFWGLNLKPNRKYSQKTDKSFHISHAALDGQTVGSEGGENRIYLTAENEKFLICTLKKGLVDQVMLDLNFAKGDDICFQSVGSGHVCLSGYIIEDMGTDFDDPDDLKKKQEVSDTDSEELIPLSNGAYRPWYPECQKKAMAEAKAKAMLESSDDDSDSQDERDSILDSTEQEDETGDDSNNSDEDKDDEDGDNDSEEEDDDDDEEEEEEEPKKKQPKLDKSKKSKQNGSVASKKDSPASDKSKGKKDKQAQNQKQQQPQQKSGERTLAGGVKVEDLKVGTGPEAKTGKRVNVYYEGRLKSNNKIFDSLKNGTPFKFGLGKGEVIKAWDIGVAGMKVGGKRRITCPPHVAYGQRGSPPQIPPNSTLVFEVELKGVN